MQNMTEVIIIRSLKISLKQHQTKCQRCKLLPSQEIHHLPLINTTLFFFFFFFFFYDCIHLCTNHKTFEPSFIKNDTRNNQFQFRIFFCCRYDQGTGLNWLESVELGGSYDHSKFEKSRLSYNQFISIRERPNCFCWVFFFFFSVWKITSTISLKFAPNAQKAYCA